MKATSLRQAILFTAILSGPLSAADWAKLPNTVARYNDWSYQFAWASPYVTPNAPAAVADFSKQNYTVRNEVFLNGTKTVGLLKFGDTLADPTNVQQTTISPGAPASGTLIFDNAGVGALIDTLASTFSPPTGPEFGIPEAANEITVPVVLNDDLTIVINTGPTSITATRWAGLNFTKPVTETGGPRHLTIDGNGRGITAFTGGSGHTGGTLIKTGTVWTGNIGSIGSGDVIINATGQCVLAGSPTVANHFTIAGTGVPGPEGDRGALFFSKSSNATTTGTITLTANSRIEGGKNSLTRLTGPLIGSANLELNAIPEPIANEPRRGDFILTGNASTLTGKLSVSRGHLSLGPATNPGGAMDVSRSASLSGETTIAGTLRLGTNTSDTAVSAQLTVDPLTPASLQTSGNLVLSGATEVELSGLPPGPTVKILGYGDTLSGPLSNLSLAGGLASYRAGTGFDTTTNPGEILLNVVRSAVVWNAGTANWNATDTNWVGGEIFHFLDDVTFDDSTPGGGLVTIQGDLRAGNILVNNSTSNDFILNANSGDLDTPLGNSIVSGSLTKNGGGKLSMGNSIAATYNRHTFSGGTTIHQGSVELFQNGDAGLRHGPLGIGSITMNAGQLFGNSAQPLSLYNAMTFNGNITLGSTSSTAQLRIASPITLGTSLTLDIPSEISLGKNNDPTTGVTDGGAGYSFTKNGTGLLEFGIATTNSWGGATTIQAGTLRMRGNLASSGLTIVSGATLSGDGSIACPITVDAGATITPANGSSNLFTVTLALGSQLDLAGTYRCDFNAATSDRINVAGELDLTNACLVLNQLASPTAAAYVIARYGSRIGAFGNVTGVPAGYQLDYAYNDGSGPNHIAVVIPTPFLKWAQARGLTPGVNDGQADDPNHDGTPNLAHFAFDTDPLGSGGNEGKRRLEITPDGGSDTFLTLTLPLRKNATFAGNPLQATIDGIIYQILGDDDLSPPHGLAVTVELPAVSASLPPLGDYDGAAGPDWEYRTFRLVESVTIRPAAFLIPAVSSAP